MKARKENVVIFGNSIAAIILALELKSEDNKIHLFNPGNNWGGIFSGIKKSNEIFDIGMNLLEFSVSSNNENLESKVNLNLKVRSTYRNRFVEIYRYLEKITDLAQVETPKIIYENKLYDDYLISDKLNILDSLSNSLKNKIEKEVNYLTKEENKPKYHASFKSLTPDFFLKKSYEEISILNHGKTFHEIFIEKMVKKILNIDSSEIPSLFHRISWCPIYYPETILAYIRHNENNLSTKFHYPKHKNFNEVVDILFKRLEENEIKLIYKTPFDLKFIKERFNNKISNSNIYYCGNFETYYKDQIQTNDIQFDKTSFIQFYVNVLKNDLLIDFSVLFINDDDFPFFRITNMNNCSKEDASLNKLVIEANYEFMLSKNPEMSEERYIEFVIRFLKKKNIIKKNSLPSIDFQIFKKVILLPTFSNLKKYNDLIIPDEYKGQHLIGDTVNIFSNSLNEQIIQVFEKVNHEEK